MKREDRAPRIGRVLLGLSLVAGVLHASGCQSIAGIVDRRYEPAGADGGKVTSALCSSYCDTVMAGCLDPFTVYPSKDVCLGICALLPAGDPKTHTGNTVACRAEQANLARKSGELNQYCPAAGPGGAGVCGDDCDSYCSLYPKLCPNDATDDCTTKCKVLLDDGTFDAVKNHDGDTLQCRLVHTGNATLDPATHCDHAALAPRPGSPCDIPTPNCDDYCRVVMGACTDANAVYESADQCHGVCAALDVGKSSDIKEDTLGCRTYHSYNALDIDPKAHCSHAGPGGDGHCGTGNCPPFCKLLAAACPTEFATFEDEAACEAACEKVPGAAKDSAGTVASARSGGDSVACRLLHVSRAFNDQTECAAALNGDPCQ